MSVRRPRLWSRQRGPAAVTLPDGARGPPLRAGIMVKELIDEMCARSDVKITPISRPFFALCDSKSGHCLPPYQELDQSSVHKEYQLRVFVNTRSNCAQFRSTNAASYHLYYKQVKREFMGDKLYPRVTNNTAIWMVAIDINREAAEKKKGFDDFLHRGKSELLKFMPQYLYDKWKKDESLKKHLKSIFDKFYNKSDPVIPDHFIGKYLEVYEKDRMCGLHIFLLKPTSTAAVRHNNQQFVVLASHEGVYKTREKDKEKEMVCKIEQLTAVEVDQAGAVATLRIDDESAERTTKQLFFQEPSDVVSFAVILDTYYRLLVDANTVILAGSLKPPERFLRVGDNDGLKVDLCHAPIGPVAVHRLLNRDMKDGNFLVRESRHSYSAFTLSLCHNHEIKNYRIVRQSDGFLVFEDVANGDDTSSDSGITERERFPTLDHLIRYHRQKQDGLPTFLHNNYSPSVTGSIPLLGTRIRHDSEISENSSVQGETPTPTSGSGTSSPISLPPADRDQPDDSSTSSLGLSSPSLPSPSTPPLPPTQPSLVPEDMPSFLTELMDSGVEYIKFDDISQIEELGKGNFSEVILGSYRGEKLALKIPTMNSTNSDIVKKELHQEIVTMMRLQHNSIVKLKGISYTKPNLRRFLGIVPVIVMEFIEKGSLRSELDKLRKANDPVKKQQACLTYINFSQQIASGMNYLEENKVVHRDLAARNVLIVSEQHVKISDFGLARRMMKESNEYAAYYKAATPKDLPIYWFAPECLDELKFTHSSDVWSYGVTVWEMLTFGELPQTYLHEHIAGRTPGQVFKKLYEYLKLGKRLPFNKSVPSLPDQFHHKADQFMQRCWQVDPARRPKFRELEGLCLDLKLCLT